MRPCSLDPHDIVILGYFIFQFAHGYRQIIVGSATAYDDIISPVARSSFLRRDVSATADGAQFHNAVVADDSRLDDGATAESAQLQQGSERLACERGRSYEKVKRNTFGRYNGQFSPDNGQYNSNQFSQDNGQLGQKHGQVGRDNGQFNHNNGQYDHFKQNLDKFSDDNGQFRQENNQLSEGNGKFGHVNHHSIKGNGQFSPNNGQFSTNDDRDSYSVGQSSQAITGQNSYVLADQFSRDEGKGQFGPGDAIGPRTNDDNQAAESDISSVANANRPTRDASGVFQGSLTQARGNVKTGKPLINCRS